VGIFGSRRFDSHLLLTLVDAMQVKVLDENPVLPEAGRAKAIVPEPKAPAPAPVVPKEAPADYESPTPDFSGSKEAPESPAESTQEPPDKPDEATDSTPGSDENPGDESGDDLPAVEVEEVSENAAESGDETGLPAAPAPFRLDPA
jgi:hypothetical protein